MKLSEAVKGKEYTVVRLGGERDAARRMFEMGLAPGAPLTVLRFSPLRSSILVGIGETLLAIRTDAASAVEVRPASGERRP